MKRLFSLLLFVLSPFVARAQQQPFPGQPGGANGQLQCNVNSFMGPCNAFDLNGQFSINDILFAASNSVFKGPNPYVDATAFGVRAIAGGTAPNTTFSSTSGSPNVTIALDPGFKNGDGVALYGAGSGTIVAPAAPTVVPSLAAAQTGTLLDVNGPTGGTTYCYQLVARSLRGATNVSPETCTTTGPASLGLQTNTITSVALSNTTATYLTSAPHGLVVGAHIVVTNVGTQVFGSGPGGQANFIPFNGWFTVATVPDNTHFTVNLLSDTRNGAVAAGTGGTVNYWNDIRITATETAGNFQYYVYGRVSGGTKTLIGTMWPQNSQFLGDATYLAFDDFGSTVTTFPNPPLYIPTTVPTTPTHDMLSTTIVSGAGTTSLVLANNAGNSISGQTIIFDDAVTFLAGATYAANNGGGTNGPLLLPETGNSALNYHFNSPISLGAGATSRITVVQRGGTVIVNEPITINFVSWYGNPSSNMSCSSFGSQCTPAITVGRSSPGFYATGNAFLFDVTFSMSSTNGSTAYIQDGGGIPSAGTFRNVGWGLSTATSYSNMGAIFRSGAGFQFTNTLLSSSQNGNLTANTPGMYFNLGTNATFTNLNLSGVGVATRVNTSGGFLLVDNVYSQGNYEPYFSFLNSNGANFAADIRQSVFDTTNLPLVANYGGAPLSLILHNPNASANDPLVTGSFPPGSVPRTAIHINGASSGSGTPQNVNMSQINEAQTVFDGTFGQTTMSVDSLNRSLALGLGYSLFTATGFYPAPTCPVSAGGSIPVGTFTYTYAPIFPNGSTGNYSFLCSATTSSGNQTVSLNWSAIPSVTQYNVFRSSGGGAVALPASPVSTNSFVDTLAGPLGNVAPNSASGGPAGMRGGLVWDQTEQIGLSSITSNATVARSVVLPDGAGTIPLGVTAPITQNAAGVIACANCFNLSTSNNIGANFFDIGTHATFGNPSSGNIRLYADSGSGNLTCLTSAGANCLPGGGGGTPGGSNTQVQFNSSSAFAGNVNMTYVSPALSMGSVGNATGQVKYVGVTSGTVTTQAQDAAGTWTFKWPNGAGSAGQPMVTDGTGVGSWATLTVGGGGSGGTTFGANQLLAGNGGSAFQSLAGSTIGANPLLLLKPSNAANTALAVDTAASPSGDILDININTVKTSWFDSSAFLHTPQTTYAGSGPLMMTGNEGTCGSPVGGADIICLGDSATHDAQLSVNGGTFKPMVSSANGSPTAHGLALWSVTFPQQNSTGAGLSGQPFLSGGASADGAYNALNLAGGANIVTGLLPPANGGTGQASLAAANIVTVTGAVTIGHCSSFAATTVVQDSGGTCGGAGGSPPLHTITAATSTNTIGNATFAQRWNWALAGSTTAFIFGESAASTGANNILLQATTASASTAIPFQTDNNGNGWQLSSVGLFQKIGSGALAIPGTAKGVVVSQGNTAAATTVTGTVNQLISFDGSGNPIAADPIVSLAFVNIWTAQDVTVTRTSAAVRNPLFSQTGTLQLTWASITGSPASCTLQIQGVDSQGNALNNGSTVSVSPANGTTSQTFTAAASLQTAAQIKAIFACVTYPTAGTLTLDFTPIPNVNVTNTVQVAGTVTTTPPTNASTNIAQINGVTPLMGNGTTGTGSPRVTISSDNSAVPAAGQGATGSAVPAGSTYIGGNGSGNLTGIISCDNSSAINIASATTTQIIAISGTGGRTFICSIDLVVSASDNVALVSGSGTNCASNLAGLAGGVTAATGWNFAANGGLTKGSGLGMVYKTATTNNEVCLITSSGAQVSGSIAWTQF